MRVDAALQQAAIAAVSRAAQATGVDFSLLLETAKRESGLDRNAQAKTSSAAGLFQFIDSTWLSMIEKFGAKYGISGDAKTPGQRQALLDLRFDADIAAKLAGELTRENAGALERKLGRPPTSAEIYAAHVLGADGAGKLLAVDPGANAADVLPQAAAANRPIFYADGKALSAGEVLAKLNLDAGAVTPPSAQGPVPQQAKPMSAMMDLAAWGESWGRDFGQDLWAIALSAYRRDEDR